MAEATTIKEWLDELANSNQSTDQDSTMMQNYLRRVGFGKAVVVLGIVYLEGRGTLDFPPCSLHSMAKMILNAQK